METKYYTPKDEEFHIGFEFESKIGNGLIHPSFYEENQEWKQTVVQQGDFFTTIDPKSVRVKFLDQEDIEGLGWYHDQTTKDGAVFFFGSFDQFSLICHNHHLKFDDNYTNVRISVMLGDNLFDGKIKNKSELKRLMVQLGIIKE